MKSPIVNSFLSNIPEDIYNEVSLNIDIANRIAEMLKTRRLTQREFASKMGKKESEVSRWLTGAHGFSTKTLAKIGHVLGEPVVFTQKSVLFNFSFNYFEATQNSFIESSLDNPFCKDYYEFRNYLNPIQHAKQ